MGFGDLKTPNGLAALDAFLLDKSYIEGFTPSQADLVIFEAVGKPPAGHVNALRWYTHIASFVKVNFQFPGTKKDATSYGSASSSSCSCSKGGKCLCVDCKCTGCPCQKDDTGSCCGSEDNKAAGSCCAPAPAKTEAKPAAEDDFDLFADEEPDPEAEKLKAQRVAEYEAKKKKKEEAGKGVIAKSSILLDVKPWDDETDMVEMERLVRTIEADGLLWAAKAKLVPVGYGIKKLQIGCVVEDDKVGTDFLEDEITKFTDYVQSVDIAAFNKI